MVKQLTILISLITSCSFAQKQGLIWYFGKQSGLDFSTEIPTVLFNGQTATDISISSIQEGTTSIADSSGNILFYSGGQTIWNKNHVPMLNGSGLLGYHSSTQSSIIVPLPGSDSIFYVFSSDQFQNFNTPPQQGYRYSVVNICLDNGYGGVEAGQKNVLLCDSSTEKLSACEDANGTGYWVVGHKMFSDEFHAWHLTAGGITDTIITKIGTIHGWRSSTSNWISGAAQGQMKINSTGTKLALAVGNFAPAILDIFDFNTSTGIISNFCHIAIDSILNKRTYGIEFSPDGTKLYTAVFGGSGGKRVYQFDLTAGEGNCDSIIASRFILFQTNGNYGNYGMQLAPNGKIYLARNSQTELSCIHSPDLTGSAANFDSTAIVISGANYYTLPGFIAGYKYHNGIASCASPDGMTERDQNMQIVLSPNPSRNRFILSITGWFIYQEYQVAIYNRLGQEIWQSVEKAMAPNEGQIEIDLSSHPEGVYLVRVFAGEAVASRKVLVVR